MRGQKRKRVEVPTGKIPSPGVRTVTLRAFAKERGVSHTAVVKAVQSGRIAGAVHRNVRGVPRIDPVKATLLLEQETDISMQRPLAARRPGPGAPKKQRSVEPELFEPTPAQTPAQASQPPPNSEGLSNSQSFARARAAREHIEAKLAHLDWQKKIGALVSADEVRGRAARVAREVREQLINIPPRIAERLAVETNAFQVQVLLEAEIDRALELLADSAKGR